MILITFSSSDEVNEVLRNTAKLKNTTISVERDLTRDTRVRRSKFLNIRRQIRAVNKTIDIRVRNHYMLIDNDKYEFDEYEKFMVKGEDGLQNIKNKHNIEVNLVNKEDILVSKTPNPVDAEWDKTVCQVNKERREYKFNITDEYTTNNFNNCSNLLNILSYNVSGLKNKKKFIDFFEFVHKFDIIFLIETHLLQTNENEIDQLFPQFKTKFVPAVKESIFGRASGGILVGVKNSKFFSKFTKITTIENHICVEISENNIVTTILPVYLSPSK